MAQALERAGPSYRPAQQITAPSLSNQERALDIKMDNDELSGSYKSHIDFKPRLHLENGLPLEISEGTKSPVHIWCSTAHWINVFKNSWLNPRALDTSTKYTPILSLPR